MLVEDLDQDGWDDLIIDGEDPISNLSRIEIWQNQSGQLNMKSSFFLRESRVRIMRGGDFNGDGLYDIFISQKSEDWEMLDRDVIAYANDNGLFPLPTPILDPDLAFRKGFDAFVVDIDQQGDRISMWPMIGAMNLVEIYYGVSRRAVGFR